ncbi:VOC family protein [Actinocorallia herbida]|nr:VOC family protein [Actinocorallia herbida]
MPRDDGVVPGQPCWVELAAGDPGEAASFYGELFGWRMEYEEFEGYGRFMHEGKSAAGLWPEATSGAAANWTVYFTVEDVRTSADLVREAGGQIVVEPRSLNGHGTLAGCLDPEDVFFMLWKPEDWGCTQAAGRPGYWSWTELLTRDPERAQGFYPRVFGWGRVRESDRVHWTVGGRVVASMKPIPPETGAETLSAWLVHFAVADVREAADRAEALGAVRIKELDDPLYGLAITLADPQDAQFVLIPVPPPETAGRFPIAAR